jgi:UrcA family protein
MRTRHILSVLTAVLATLLVWLPALAAAQGDAPSPPSLTVRFDPHLLTRPEGVAALYWRISAAAHEVCVGLDQRDLWRWYDALTCERAAKVAAIKQIGDSALTEFARRAEFLIPPARANEAP